MGARPSQFSGGGGRLNGVDAVITGYTFTDEFLGYPFEPGKFKDQKGKMLDKTHNLYLEVSVRVDGADEDAVEPLRVSRDFDAFEVSEDGRTLTRADGGPCTFNRNTAAAKFINSLVTPPEGDLSFPEDRFDDTLEAINLEPMIGTRVRLVKQLDKEATSFAKEQGGSGKRKGKDGKEYNFENLIVERVYALPEDAAPPAKTAKAPVKGAKPAATKQAVAPAAKTAKGGKANGAAKVEIADVAVTVLKEIIADNKGSVLKHKLSMPILKKLTTSGQAAIRDDVRTWLFNDENLDGIDGIVYDRESGEIATA